MIPSPHALRTELTVAVFAVVYAGMFLGRLPRLRLDRTGVALLGAIALIGGGVLTLDEAARAIDVSTIALLFAFMVISAQLRLGGFYTRVATAVTGLRVSAGQLLAAVVLVSGALSAVFTNDIVCLAVAPVLIQACRRRDLDPVPFLLALACAANIGSAATLIGNPQNILIGQVLHLDFAAYLGFAAMPSLLGLALTWGVIATQYRGRWKSADAGAVEADLTLPAWDRWQAAKGLAVTAALLVAFLGSAAPRDTLALAAAGLLLCSRRLHSRQMLGLVDWQILVLFCGLFVVNHGLQASGVPERLVAHLAALGIDPAAPAWLGAMTVVLSNAVSNVPAVMLLLPMVGDGSTAGPLLALCSTLAGNLLIVGSIANVIVVDTAARAGIPIDWRRHARTGGTVTVLSLAVTAAWLWLCQ